MSLDTRVIYYSDLLAYLYRGLPNATRQIQLWCALMTGETLPDQLITAFDLDTAVGAQLDVLGKYIGVSRNIGIVQTRPYFGLWNPQQTDLVPSEYQGTWNPNTNTPLIDSSATAGQWWAVSVTGDSTAPINSSWFAGYAIVCTGTGTFGRATAANNNGLTSSSDPSVNANAFFFSTAYLSGQNSDLTDAEYRTVLKLKIVQNSSDGTLASIMAYLQEFFPGLISLTDDKNMRLSYQVVSTVALSQELLTIYLPRPMAVGISVTIVSPTPGSEGIFTTEGGDTLTTEGGDTLITEGS